MVFFFFLGGGGVDAPGPLRKYDLCESNYYLTSGCEHEHCEPVGSDVACSQNQICHRVRDGTEHRNDHDVDGNFRRKYGQEIRAESVNSRQSFSSDHSLVVRN